MDHITIRDGIGKNEGEGITGGVLLGGDGGTGTAVADPVDQGVQSHTGVRSDLNQQLFTGKDLGNGSCTVGCGGDYRLCAGATCAGGNGRIDLILDSDIFKQCDNCKLDRIQLIIAGQTINKVTVIQSGKCKLLCAGAGGGGTGQVHGFTGISAGDGYGLDCVTFIRSDHNREVVGTMGKAAHLTMVGTSHDQIGGSALCFGILGCGGTVSGIGTGNGTQVLVSHAMGTHSGGGHGVFLLDGLAADGQIAGDDDVLGQGLGTVADDGLGGAGNDCNRHRTGNAHIACTCACDGMGDEAVGGSGCGRIGLQFQPCGQGVQRGSGKCLAHALQHLHCIVPDCCCHIALQEVLQLGHIEDAGQNFVSDIGCHLIQLGCRRQSVLIGIVRRDLLAPGKSLKLGEHQIQNCFLHVLLDGLSQFGTQVCQTAFDLLLNIGGDQVLQTGTAEQGIDCVTDHLTECTVFTEEVIIEYGPAASQSLFQIQFLGNFIKQFLESLVDQLLNDGVALVVLQCSGFLQQVLVHQCSDFQVTGLDGCITDLGQIIIGNHIDGNCHTHADLRLGGAGIAIDSCDGIVGSIHADLAAVGSFNVDTAVDDCFGNILLNIQNECGCDLDVAFRGLCLLAVCYLAGQGACAQISGTGAASHFNAAGDSLVGLFVSLRFFARSFRVSLPIGSVAGRGCGSGTGGSAGGCTLGTCPGCSLHGGTADSVDTDIVGLDTAAQICSCAVIHNRQSKGAAHAYVAACSGCVSCHFPEHCALGDDLCITGCLEGYIVLQLAEGCFRIDTADQQTQYGSNGDAACGTCLGSHVLGTGVVGAELNGIQRFAGSDSQIQTVFHIGKDIHTGHGDGDACAHAHTGSGTGSGGTGAFGHGDNVFHAGSGNSEIAAVQDDDSLVGNGFTIVLIGAFLGDVSLRFGNQHMNCQSAGHTEVALGVACLGGGAGNQLAAVAAGNCIQIQAIGSDVGLFHISAVFMRGHGDVHTYAGGEGGLAGLGEAAVISNKVAVDLDAFDSHAVAGLQGIGIFAAGIGCDGFHKFGGSRTVGTDDVDLQGILLQSVACVGGNHKAEGGAQVSFLTGGNGAVVIGDNGNIIGAGNCRTLGSCDLDVAAEAFGNLEREGTVGILGNGDIHSLCGGFCARSTGDGLAAGDGDGEGLAAAEGCVRHGQNHGVAGGGSCIRCLQEAVGGDRQILFHKGNCEVHICGGHHESKFIIADGCCGEACIGEGDLCSHAGMGSDCQGNSVAGIGAGYHLQPVGIHAGVRESAGDLVSVCDKFSRNTVDHILAHGNSRKHKGIAGGVTAVTVTLHSDVLAGCILVVHRQRSAGLVTVLQQVTQFGGNGEFKHIGLAQFHIGQISFIDQSDRTVDHGRDDQLDIVGFCAHIILSGRGDLSAVHAVGGLGLGNSGIIILVLADNTAVGQSGVLGQGCGLDVHSALGSLDGAGGIRVGIVVVDHNAHCKCADQLAAGGAAGSGGTAGAAGTAGAGLKGSVEGHIALGHSKNVLALGIGADLGNGGASVQSGDQLQFFQRMANAGSYADQNILSGVSSLGVSDNKTGTGTGISGIADGISSAVIFRGYESAAVGACVIQLIFNGGADLAGAVGQSCLALSQRPEDCLDDHVVCGHGKGKIRAGCLLVIIVVNQSNGFDQRVVFHAHNKNLHKIDGIALLGCNFDQSLFAFIALMGSGNGTVLGAVHGNDEIAAGGIVCGFIEVIGKSVNRLGILQELQTLSLEHLKQAAQQADDLAGGLVLDQAGRILCGVCLGDDDFLGIAENIDIAEICNQIAGTCEGCFHILEHQRNGEETAEVDAGAGDGIVLFIGYRCFQGRISLGIGYGAGVQSDVACLGDHGAFHDDIHVSADNSKCQGNRE